MVRVYANGGGGVAGGDGIMGWGCSAGCEQPPIGHDYVACMPSSSSSQSCYSRQLVSVRICELTNANELLYHCINTTSYVFLGYCSIQNSTERFSCIQRPK
jgi:hypothetical protein